MIATDRIVCPSCGYTLEGLIDECGEPGFENTESD